MKHLSLPRFSEPVARELRNLGRRKQRRCRRFVRSSQEFGKGLAALVLYWTSRFHFDKVLIKHRAGSRLGVVKFDVNGRSCWREGEDHPGPFVPLRAAACATNLPLGEMMRPPGSTTFTPARRAGLTAICVSRLLTVNDAFLCQTVNMGCLV